MGARSQRTGHDVEDHPEAAPSPVLFHLGCVGLLHLYLCSFALVLPLTADDPKPEALDPKP